MSGFLSLTPPAVLMLLGLSTGAAAQAPEVDPNNATCVEVASEPPPAAYPEVGPTQVARCRYGRAELVLRFTRLLESRAPRLELEAVEAAFGLPRLRAAPFSDPRSAWYSVNLQGEGPDGAWEAYINFREQFFPLYDFRPARLRGTERPTPIDADDRGSILFLLQLRRPTPEPGAPACIPVSAPFDRALAAGWRDDTESASYATHGGPKSVMLTRGDMTYFPGIHTQRVVAPRSEIDAACFSEGRIDQEPTRPGPPISAEEQSLIDRQRR